MTSQMPEIPITLKSVLSHLKNIQRLRNGIASLMAIAESTRQTAITTTTTCQYGARAMPTLTVPSHAAKIRTNSLMIRIKSSWNWKSELMACILRPIWLTSCLKTTMPRLRLLRWGWHLNQKNAMKILMARQSSLMLTSLATIVTVPW